MKSGVHAVQTDVTSLSLHVSQSIYSVYFILQAQNIENIKNILTKYQASDKFSGKKW